MVNCEMPAREQQGQRPAVATEPCEQVWLTATATTQAYVKCFCCVVPGSFGPAASRAGPRARQRSTRGTFKQQITCKPHRSANTVA